MPRNYDPVTWGTCSHFQEFAYISAWIFEWSLLRQYTILYYSPTTHMVTCTHTHTQFHGAHSVSSSCQSLRKKFQLVYPSCALNINTINNSSGITSLLHLFNACSTATCFSHSVLQPSASVFTIMKMVQKRTMPHISTKIIILIQGFFMELDLITLKRWILAFVLIVRS